MKILCISDATDTLIYSKNAPERYKDVDFVISSGDLPLRYYDYIQTVLKKDVIYAGIVADHLEAWEKEYQKEYQMKFLTPDQLAEDSGPLLDWLRENGYKHVMIHWDLDVISPADFRSLLCAEPHIPPVEYAVGEMTLDQILRLIKDVSAEFDVVALGITEFLPWDIIRLQKGLGELSIFHE